jgi:hypothetical protein
MPITSNNPVTVNGTTYERFAVSLAISPAWKENDLGPSLAMRLERYTKDAEGNVIKLQNPPAAEGEQPVDYSSSLVYSALAMSSPEIEQKVRELMDAVQDLINMKGL